MPKSKQVFWRAGGTLKYLKTTRNTKRLSTESESSTIYPATKSSPADVPLYKVKPMARRTAGMSVRRAFVMPSLYISVMTPLFRRLLLSSAMSTAPLPSSSSMLKSRFACCSSQETLSFCRSPSNSTKSRAPSLGTLVSPSARMSSALPTSRRSVVHKARNCSLSSLVSSTAVCGPAPPGAAAYLGNAGVAPLALTQLRRLSAAKQHVPRTPMLKQVVLAMLP
mmetsp:Transcript_7481/g.20755  ORF Transcript_7481/g.20755 Transcript_7481/m.20755 type:complete len:223 (-) Transcript_7481:128-796(-)